MTTRFVATRAELLRTRRQLGRVRQGIVLTRRKREALVAELFRAATPAAARRERVAEAAAAAARALAAALEARGLGALAVTALPAGDLAVDVVPTQIWGLAVSDIRAVQAPAADAAARDRAAALAGPAIGLTAQRYAALTALLVEAAPAEQRLRRLGDAVAEASRRLRALEQRLEPSLAARAAHVQAALDEREREEHVRLRAVREALRRRRAEGRDADGSR
jgi:V/A-type H+/Na+-transporting ATPase subunit D